MTLLAPPLFTNFGLGSDCTRRAGSDTSSLISDMAAYDIAIATKGRALRVVWVDDVHRSHKV